jgi:hypothetical protein
MRTSVFALMTAAAMLSAVSLRAAGAEVGAIRLAQVDVDVWMGPSRSPDIVIEEPRPPSAAIETEGRGEHRNCHAVTVTEWQDGVKVTRTEQQCDR